MKHIALFLLASLLCTVARANTQTLTATIDPSVDVVGTVNESATVTVPAGGVAHILSVNDSSFPYGDARLLVTTPVETAVLLADSDLGGTFIAGPCDLKATLERVSGPGGTPTVPFSVLVTVEIRADDDASLVPSNSVVIPTDATGNVEIILESSQDMITWNAANPGTYGSSTPERFFRVRAVVND